MAGVYDWAYAYGTLALGDLVIDDGRDRALEINVVEDGQVRLGGPFWKNWCAYVRSSPIFDVEKFDAPLLLLDGDRLKAESRPACSLGIRSGGGDRLLDIVRRMAGEILGDLADQLGR